MKRTKTVTPSYIHMCFDDEISFRCDYCGSYYRHEYRLENDERKWAKALEALAELHRDCTPQMELP